MLTKKNAQLSVEEKKIKKRNTSANTALPPTRRKSPHTKPKAAGMREHNRSLQAKKSLRSSIKRKEKKYKLLIIKDLIKNNLKIATL